MLGLASGVGGGRAALRVVATMSLLVLAACSPWTESDLAPGISASKIRSLSRGMAENDVLARLGPPLARGVLPTGQVVLSYARPVPGARQYPMVDVVLESGRIRVVSVQLK